MSIDWTVAEPANRCIPGWEKRLHRLYGIFPLSSSSSRRYRQNFDMTVLLNAHGSTAEEEGGAKTHPERL